MTPTTEQIYANYENRENLDNWPQVGQNMDLWNMGVWEKMRCRSVMVRNLIITVVQIYTTQGTESLQDEE